MTGERSLLFFLEGNAFDSPRQNKKVCMGTEDLMGYLVAWADSRVTERPESSGIRSLPHLILCLCSLIQSLGSTHVQIDMCEGEGTAVIAISQVLGTQSPKLISKQED